jgi:hypothetical protein
MVIGYSAWASHVGAFGKGKTVNEMRRVRKKTAAKNLRVRRRGILLNSSVYKAFVNKKQPPGLLEVVKENRLYIRVGKLFANR